MAERQMTCKRCDVRKPVTAFSQDRSRPKAASRFPWCKTCCVEYSRERKAFRWVGDEGDRKCPVCLVGLEGAHANRRFCSHACKETARRYKTFGLEPEEYRALVASTEGKCPICRKTVKKWQMDHNHNTGETMGVVCAMCNQNLIAYAYHDPDIARRLVTFLESPPVRTMFGERRYVGPESLSQLHRMWAWA